MQVDGSAWLGGGCDLTPNYLTYQIEQENTHDTSSGIAPREVDLREDITIFHQFWKSICDQYKPMLYGELKSWCDRCWICWLSVH
jgi:coproporphyrinogen III oxidase